MTVDKYVKKSEASQHTHFYGAWASGISLEVGDIVLANGVAWEVQTAHTTTGGDEPSYP